MLDFKSITIEDKQAVDSIIKPLKLCLCANCFVDLFIWKNVYDTQICIEDNFVFIKQKLDNKDIYTVPLGTGDMKKAIKKLYKDSVERNNEFTLYAISMRTMQQLEEAFPQQFVFEEQRDSSDYIYTSESLKTLAGKKLHSKRNFINRFMTTYDGRWLYEEITKNNIHEAFNYHLEWCNLNNDNENNDFKGETSAISNALRNLDELQIKGGMLKIDGQVVAFSLGSYAHDEMFIVHIEKADYTIAGCYPMINNQFALHNFNDVQLINREEDLGIDGLRKAKLSYNPFMMGTNYIGKIRNDEVLK